MRSKKEKDEPPLKSCQEAGRVASSLPAHEPNDPPVELDLGSLPMQALRSGEEREVEYVP